MTVLVAMPGVYRSMFDPPVFILPGHLNKSLLLTKLRKIETKVLNGVIELPRKYCIKNLIYSPLVDVRRRPGVNQIENL